MRLSLHPRGALAPIFICALLAAVAVSCKNDTAGTGTPGVFSVTAHVTYAGGASAAGKRIAFWNDLRYTPIPARRSPPLRRTAAATGIHFGVPVRSHVTLRVLDFLSTPFGLPIVDTTLEAGYYFSVWQTDTTLPIALLKLVLEGRDSATNALLERKNIFMLLYQPDIGTSMNGFTDATGRYRTVDPLAFPNVLETPLLVHTADDPTPLGYIGILDSVTVVVKDTATGEAQWFRRRIVAGDNALTLVFAPGPAAPEPPAAAAWRPETALTRLGASPIPSQFVLVQNFPNPFN